MATPIIHLKPFRDLVIAHPTNTRLLSAELLKWRPLTLLKVVNETNQKHRSYNHHHHTTTMSETSSLKLSGVVRSRLIIAKSRFIKKSKSISAFNHISELIRSRPRLYVHTTFFNKLKGKLSKIKEEKTSIDHSKQNQLQQQKQQTFINSEVTEIGKATLGFIPYNHDNSIFHKSLRTGLITILGSASKFIMSGMNTTTIYGAENLRKAISKTEQKGVITVSNHISAVDDPFTLAPLLPMSEFIRDFGGGARYTFCATNRCFLNGPMGKLFNYGKVLPAAKGGGIRQPSMEFAINRLQLGDWVHIFPEGTRSRTGKMGTMKPGIGRLVAGSTPSTNPTAHPIVIPIVHSGMEKLHKRPFGNQIHILVGEPIHFDDLIEAFRLTQGTEEELWIAISDRVGRELQRLTLELRFKQLEEEEQRFNAA